MKLKRTLKSIVGGVFIFAASLPMGRIALAADNSDYDRNFMQAAAEAGATEMEVGKLVTSNHASRAVKDFAAAMTRDHGWVAVASKHLLASKHIDVSHAPNKDHQAEINELQGLAGKEFDKRYAKVAVEGHKGTLDLFTDASKNAVDPDLKAFARKMVPQVQRHYRMAVNLESAVAKE